MGSVSMERAHCVVASNVCTCWSAVLAPDSCISCSMTALLLKPSTEVCRGPDAHVIACPVMSSMAGRLHMYGECQAIWLILSPPV